MVDVPEMQVFFRLANHPDFSIPVSITARDGSFESFPLFDHYTKVVTGDFNMHSVFVDSFGSYHADLLSTSPSP
jgi:hypothetical protein